MFLLDEIDGEIAGYVVGYLNHRSFGHPKVFMEVSEMFVKPEFRKGPCGFRLLRAITKATKRIGIKHMEMCALTTERQTNQALRAGFKPYIQRFYKRV